MVQGLGAGSLMTLGYTIIGGLFGIERRAKLRGWISSVWGVASLVGPWLGGVLSDHVSWRWVFYVNLPFGAIAMALIATALVEEARPARRPVMDVAGVALFTAGVSALLLGIVQAGGARGLAGAPRPGPPAPRPTRARPVVGVGRPAAPPA